MSFSPEKIQQVWEKGTYVTNEWRKDACGAWIHRDHYGHTETDYGWEIDHIIPKARGGSDDLSNLRPLHHMNNRAKAEGRTDCVVTSKGNTNVQVS